MGQKGVRKDENSWNATAVYLFSVIYMVHLQERIADLFKQCLCFISEIFTEMNRATRIETYDRN